VITAEKTGIASRAVVVFACFGDELKNRSCDMKSRAYLDIETTGLSRYRADLTVIGIALEKGSKLELVQLTRKHLCRRQVLNVLAGADEIYTYNGSRFDLPFIKAKLAVDLNELFNHTDLMYNCWQKGLKGGLKVVEQILGINRRLREIDGRIAVQLWWSYVNENNKNALRLLLEYNREDVLNLRLLRRILNVA